MQNREANTGKYTFDGDMSRLCVCGHALGLHTAARVRLDGKTLQPCADSHAPDCKCQCFKPAKKASQ